MGFRIYLFVCRWRGGSFVGSTGAHFSGISIIKILPCVLSVDSGCEVGGGSILPSVCTNPSADLVLVRALIYTCSLS